ncbi:alpha-mannosidase [Lacticaseibacillus mingshuiensis]|uniref:Alpha-mannosidase n=1 Tax=Lacticaseibacillus mingshuiensis TaxID=2799574 RepID=A0ABW4CIT8_9LACO|nr:glycoside hydrolase family 38 C-terminal domain-containing protein [Lacticaseibacillus mingshuiensis]
MEQKISDFLAKANQQLHILQSYTYANFTPVAGLELTPDTREDNRWEPEDATWSPIEQGAKWEGRDKYFWLRFTITVPEIPAGGHFVLHTELGRTGGNGSAFEGLVFVNGAPRQAVDYNHRDAYFEDSFSGQTLHVVIKLWTGTEGGGVPRVQHYTLETLASGIIDQHVVDAAAYLENIIETIAQLGPDEPLRYGYIALVKKSFQQFVWAEVTPENVGTIAASVLGQIQQFIAAHAGEKKAYTITAVGHTHIDVAWLWRLRHTREKIARSFSTVLELMKEYPDYIFFQSTPQDYAYLEKDYPDLWKQIQARIKEGRWEANGATWLEPDTNIPSGESLTRQFLYGIGYFKEKFGARQNVLWLPDVFGYSAATPQIMKGFGVDNFMTTKISWNDTNRMPHDTFYWQGIDGTKVLTHFITTVDNWTNLDDPNQWTYTYNGTLTPKSVLGSYHVYADKGLNDDLLVSYGFGDGGGGPTREMIKNMKILDELPGLPHVKPGRADDYFDRLDKRVAAAQDEVATWQGELYLEFHRGTYTSQANVKKWNRRAEFALRDLELRYSAAHVQHGVTYPTEAIRDLWIILLRNQFHDILPGSAIHEVYEDAAVEFKQLFDGVADLQAKLQAAFATPATDHVLVENTLAWPRTELVALPAGVQAATDGKQLATVHTAEKTVVAVTVPAMGAVALTVTAGTGAETADAGEAAGTGVAAPEAVTPKQTATAAPHTLVTPFYKVTYAKDGRLEQIRDLKHDRDLLDETRGGNVLTLYEDKPLTYDDWNIDQDYPEKATRLVADSVTLGENNAFYADLDLVYTFGASKLTQTMRFYADKPQIDFLTHVDWHERQRLLRTAFNTNLLADNARYDIQYGNVERPTNDNTSWDWAKFETVAHKWADLSERDYGLALLNDSKYGYRIKAKQISMTLLKSGNQPDLHADEGEHDFIYSLLPHEGDFLAGNVEKTAAELNEPLQVENGVAAPATTALFNFDAQYPVQVDAIKLAENGAHVLVRLHDYTGSHEKVTITPTTEAKAAFIAKLDESVAEDAKNVLADGSVVVTLSPYQVLTVAFDF